MPENTTPETLDLQTLAHLSDLFHAVMEKWSVKWSTDEGETIYEGTVRSIGTESFGFLPAGADVRDGFIRITSASGFEHAMPVREAVRLKNNGYLFVRPAV